MLILANAVQNTQPDYVALAMVLVLAVIVDIMAIRKHMATQKKETEISVEPIPEPIVAEPIPAAPGAAGQIKLYGVEPKTAAMVMAIVANKMDKPLNELRFISIKEVE